jgi:hypothetical protein
VARRSPKAEMIACVWLTSGCRTDSASASDDAMRVVQRWATSLGE